MANTQIQISGGGTSAFSVSPDSAPFNAGDTVTFVSAAGTADALICFSDNADVVIDPSSDDPTPIASGSKVTFKVTGTATGGCGATVVSKSHRGTPEFPDSPAGVLQIAVLKGRPDPADPGQGGDPNQGS